MTSPFPAFDLRQIPFSRRGAWINLSPVVGAHHTVDDVHLVSHRTGMHPVLSLTPRTASDHQPADWTVEATPSTVRWSRGAATMEAVFASRDTLRLRGDDGVTLRLTEAAAELTPFTGMFLFRDPRDGSPVFTSYETGCRYRITAIRGSLRVEGAESLGAAVRAVEVATADGDGWEIAIEEFETSRSPFVASSRFDRCVAEVSTEFADFARVVAPWSTGDSALTTTREASVLAAYVLWSATVAPAGFLSRESVLMSKHWMDKVWSWDHCFNALAVAPADAALALDQFLAPFDHQDPTGALPDSIAHSERLYNFVKPPIHGWAFAKLRERLARPLAADDLRLVYGHLSRWSRFWLEQRTAPGRELPHYQHGNDSGWDNSTTFDRDRVIESPDLAAFLVVQLDVLADLADELGLDEGRSWRAERDRVETALTSELLDDEGFFAVGPLSGIPSTRTSLLTLLPVLISDRLPRSVSDLLAERIAAHLTAWGPATQLVDTPEYESDGYWRGPIWAPSTMLLEEGLRRGGHVELADTVSDRFRALCERSGFAENFDALSGEGLRDRAYTWTASVYLVLAHEHAQRSSARLSEASASL